MEIVYALVFILTSTLNYIEFSSEFDCLPNGQPIPGVSRDGSSPSFDERIPADRSILTATNFSSARYTPPVRSTPPARSSSSARHPPRESPLRNRSRSPSLRETAPPTKILAFGEFCYELDQIELIRITSLNNPRRIFLLRRYTFPANTSIRKFVRLNVYEHIPTREQVVLATSNGDVYAILERSDIIVGIYAYKSSHGGRVRAKINMGSGKVTLLTKDEVREVPIGRSGNFPRFYRVQRLDPDLPYH